MTTREEDPRDSAPLPVVGDEQEWRLRAEHAEGALVKLRQLAADLDGYDNPAAQWIEELIPNDLGEPQ